MKLMTRMRNPTHSLRKAHRAMHDQPLDRDGAVASFFVGDLWALLCHGIALSRSSVATGLEARVGRGA